MGGISESLKINFINIYKNINNGFINNMGNRESER